MKKFMLNYRFGFKAYMEKVRENASNCYLKPTGSITC